MAISGAEGHEPTPPAWVKALGGLAGIAAVAFLTLFALASCTPQPEAEGRVTIVDTASLLSPAVEQQLRAIAFPPDTPVILRTVDSIPPEEIGTYATDLMDSETQWQHLRPRGFLRHYIRQDEPSATGIYVLISRTPGLVQIRFGREVRMAAYGAGLAAGKWYRARQTLNSDEQLVATVRELATRMSRVVDPPWLVGVVQSVSSTVTSEVEDFLAPSDGLYSTAILGGYLRIAQWMRATSSLWRFLAFNLMVFVVFWVLGKKLLIERLLLPRTKARWARAILFIVGNLGLLGVLATGFAAIALLSRGRLEDEMALQALGLSLISNMAFDPALFSRNGGLWLAIPAVVISFIGEVLEAAAERAQALREGEERTTLTFGWVGWGCALYLLPLGIGIPAIAVLIWNTGRALVESGAEP